jgi:hypothetical protein
MPDELNSTTDSHEPLAYQIRLKGQLGSEWADWFGGVSITLEDNGTTLLTGPALDQAALHGLLKKVRDLGLTLISINPIEPDPAEVTVAGQHQSFMKGNEE